MKRITVLSTVSVLLVVCFFILVLGDDDCDGCYSLPAMMLKVLSCGFVMFIGSIYFTRLYLRTEKIIHIIESLPLLNTSEAVEGVPFSGEGIIENITGQVLISPYADIKCVYHHSIMEQYKRVGKYHRWVIVENKIGYVPFCISDQRGRLLIDPENIDSDLSGFSLPRINYRIDPGNSEIDCMPVLKKSGTEKKKFLGLFNSGEFRKSEYVLCPGERIFTYGFVEKVSGQLVLREHDNHPLLISRKSKDGYVNEFYKGRNLVFMIHLLLSVAFSMIVVSSNYFLNMAPELFYPLLISGNAILSGSILITMYNRIITLKQRAEYAKGNIDIELQRRSDLIPELEKIVKTYAAYENDIFGLLERLRHGGYYGKNFDNILKIQVLSENYPALKSSETFKKLMQALSDTEERIAYSRAFYNRNVRKLNTLVVQFPFIIIAFVTNIRPMDFLGTADPAPVTKNS